MRRGPERSTDRPDRLRHGSALPQLSVKDLCRLARDLVVDGPVGPDEPGEAARAELGGPAAQRREVVAELADLTGIQEDEGPFRATVVGYARQVVRAHRTVFELD